MKNPSLYAVRDKVADEFCAPLLLKNNDNALRWFENAYKDNPEKNIVRSDFELYAIGTYDPDTGTIDGVVTPERVDSVLLKNEEAN